MTASKEELTDEVAQAVAKFRQDSQRVEVELRLERERRMQPIRLALGLAMARARLGGVTYATLKDLYGTKDHGTIRDLVDGALTHLDTIEEVQEQIEEKPRYAFVINTASDDDGTLIDIIDTEVGGTWTFETIEMTNGVVLNTEADLYPNGFDGGRDEVVHEYDGLMLPQGAKTADHRRLVSLLRERGII